MKFKDQRRGVHKSMSEVECFSCHKLGHFARDCPSRIEKAEKPFN